MENKLPKGWVEIKLGEILKLKNGYAFKSNNYLSEGTPVIRISDIKQGIVTSEKAVRVNPVNIPNGFSLEKGDILVAMSGATTGKYGIFLEDSPAFQNQRVGNLKPHSIKHTNKKYIYYLLGSLKKEIEDKAYGGAQPNISSKLIESINCGLPPLPEQKRIVAKLDTLFAHLEKLQAELDRIPQLLKDFRQSVLTQAVTGKLTEEWREGKELEDAKNLLKKINSTFKTKYNKKHEFNLVKPQYWTFCFLGNIINVKSGIGLSAKNREKGNIPVFGGNGITGYHSQGNVSEKTITIGRVGYYCGIVHVTPKEAWITDNALIVSFPQKYIKFDFLHILLKGTNLRENSSSTAQPVISGGKIYKLKIIIPPLSEQTEIVRQVEHLFSIADRIEAQYEELKDKIEVLPQAILAKAFRGELVEQLPTDGDARELLKEIQALKASMKKTTRGKRK